MGDINDKRAEIITSLSERLQQAIHEAIDRSASVQGVMWQLRLLDVQAEAEVTVMLSYAPLAPVPKDVERRRDRAWLGELGIRADEQG